MRDDTAAPGSLEALRERNRALVLHALRRGGAVSRAELARRTGLSRSTISTVVADLVAAGIASEGGTAAPEGVGRPGVPVTLNAAAGTAVGIDIGGAAGRVVLADLGHVRSWRRTPSRSRPTCRSTGCSTRSTPPWPRSSRRPGCRRSG